MANTVKRSISQAILELALDRKKMAFVSGPRQCGKTTMTKKIIADKNSYFNWDELAFRKQWTISTQNFAETIIHAKNDPLVAFDEFHKNIKWKNQLKAFYDLYGNQIKIIVIGSAHLNTYKKGADSLLGRFLHFRLHPLTVAELDTKNKNSFTQLESFIKNPEDFDLYSNTKLVTDLFQYSGFPEPFLSQSQKIYNVWSRSRNELMIRQDLKDLSQIMQIGQVEILSSFLPDRVGSPLSLKALSEDLDASNPSIKRWMLELEKVYHHFKVLPYAKSIIRSLKKESKIYLYDWASIKNDGAKFENMVACHLLKMVDYYTDTGEAKLEFFYLRDKEKNEVDFVIIKNNKPFFKVEVKLSETKIDKTHLQFQKITYSPFSNC